MQAAMQPTDVLAFWFGDPPSAQARGEWFRKDAAFDAQVQQRFGAALELALAGGLRQWDAEPPGALARIVVLDQFTRNAFRGTARAFAGDALALAAARELVRSVVTGCCRRCNAGLPTCRLNTPKTWAARRSRSRCSPPWRPQTPLLKARACGP